jgi:hypothetical protein
MSKLVDCPNCLGIGEEVIKGKYARLCRTCKGQGKVDSDVEHDFLENHLFDELD